MGAEEHTALDCMVRRSSEAGRTAALFAAAGATTRWSAWRAAVVTRLCSRSTQLLSNQRDASGNTLLMLAVQNNNFEVARLLLLLRPELCDLRSRNNVILLAYVQHFFKNFLLACVEFVRIKYMVNFL